MARIRHRRRMRRNPSFARNPEILGVDLEDGLAVAGGIWGTKNLANILAPVVAPITAPINSIRAGLGGATLEFASAVLIGRIGRMIRPRIGSMATLGGSALALSDAVNSLAGSVNLIGGQPQLTFPLAAPSKPTSNVQSNSNGRTMLPSGAVQVPAAALSVIGSRRTGL